MRLNAIVAVFGHIQFISNISMIPFVAVAISLKHLNSVINEFTIQHLESSKSSFRIIKTKYTAVWSKYLHWYQQQLFQKNFISVCAVEFTFIWTMTHKFVCQVWKWLFHFNGTSECLLYLYQILSNTWTHDYLCVQTECCWY